MRDTIAVEMSAARASSVSVSPVALQLSRTLAPITCSRFRLTTSGAPDPVANRMLPFTVAWISAVG